MIIYRYTTNSHYNEEGEAEEVKERTEARDAEVAKWVEVLKLRYAGMKIAVGRDKLDEIQVTRLVIFLCTKKDADKFKI